MKHCSLHAETPKTLFDVLPVVGPEYRPQARILEREIKILFCILAPGRLVEQSVQLGRVWPTPDRQSLVHLAGCSASSLIYGLSRFSSPYRW